MRINNPDYLVIIKQVPDPKNPSIAGATVQAPLPDTLAYDTASEYSTPFAQGMLSQGALSQALSSAGVRVTTQAMTAQLWQGSTENDIGLELEFQTYDDPDKDVRQPVLTLLKLAAASIDTATGLLQSPGPRISLEDTGKILSSGGSQLANSGKQVLNASAAAIGFKGRLNVSKLNAQTDNLNSNQKANVTPTAVENGLGGAQYWKSIVRNQISIQIGNYAFFDSVVILNAQETKSHQIDFRTGLPLHSKVNLRFKPLFLVTQQDLDQIFSGGQR
jgi:hypothetical protein